MELEEGPREGGSYLANKDGSRTLLHRTQPSPIENLVAEEETEATEAEQTEEDTNESED
jgi:hypothetical protein